MEQHQVNLLTFQATPRGAVLWLEHSSFFVLRIYGRRFKLESLCASCGSSISHGQKGVYMYILYFNTNGPANSSSGRTKLGQLSPKYHKGGLIITWPGLKHEGRKEIRRTGCIGEVRSYRVRCENEHVTVIFSC